LHSLWPAIGADAESYHALGGEAQIETEIAPAATQSRQRLKQQPAPLEAPDGVQSRGEILPSTAEQDEIEFSWARQTARRVGTVVHEALERFGRTGPPTPDELPRMRARLESRLQGLGIETARAKEGAEFALRALSATLADPRGRWLFDPAHTEAHSELALSGLRGTQVINAVIDRTFVAADGTRWVVDFKTSPHEGGDRETFLDEEARRYSAQLTRYAQLASRLGPQPVRAGLYYPLLAAWREIEVVSTTPRS
jgi:ATP-dependent exoDNAse (exonuclease V) beta subunit